MIKEKSLKKNCLVNESKRERLKHWENLKQSAHYMILVFSLLLQSLKEDDIKRRITEVFYCWYNDVLQRSVNCIVIRETESYNSSEFSLLVYAHLGLSSSFGLRVWEIYSCKKRSSHWVHYEYLFSMNIYYLY